MHQSTFLQEEPSCKFCLNILAQIEQYWKYCDFPDIFNFTVKEGSSVNISCKDSIGLVIQILDARFGLQNGSANVDVNSLSYMKSRLDP